MTKLQTRRAPRAAALAVAMVVLLAGGAAHAGLGQPAGSVRRDLAAWPGATLTLHAAGGLRVHEIATADGVRVRQYESACGTVVAATWQGPAMPDLRLLLGPHYGRFAAAARDGTATTKRLDVGSEELVVRVARLPRGIAGSAWLPALLPPGALAEVARLERTP